MSTFLKTLGSTVSSPVEMAWGIKCWQELVRSCHAAKCWADETDDDSDAYLTIPEVTADADTAATVSEVDAKAVVDDFFSEPYVSFDWADEDEVSRSISPSCSNATASIVGCKFEQGRYLPTIMEEDEEVLDEVCPVPEVYEHHSPTPEAEQRLLETPQHDILRLLHGKVDLCRLDIIVRMPKSVKNISLPESSPPLQVPSVNAIDPSSPSIPEMEALLDIVPARVLKRLGLPSDAISKRTPIVVRFPTPTEEILPSYDPLSNLQMLASLASNLSPPPSYFNSPLSNLNLLASCC
jgi:hypothetical protein